MILPCVSFTPTYSTTVPTCPSAKSSTYMPGTSSDEWDAAETRRACARLRQSRTFTSLSDTWRAIGKRSTRGPCFAGTLLPPIRGRSGRPSLLVLYHDPGREKALGFLCGKIVPYRTFVRPSFAITKRGLIQRLAQFGVGRSVEVKPVVERFDVGVAQAFGISAGE